MENRKILFVALTALLSAGCSAEPIEKALQVSQPAATFATPDEAQEFVKTELGEVIAASLAASKIAVLEHAGQVSTATAAPAFTPMKVLGLGDPVEVSFNYRLSTIIAGRRSVGNDSFAGTFSGAVTDVDANGKRYGTGAFAKGKIDAKITQIILYGTMPGTYVMEMKGDALFALGGQDTDTISLVLSGQTSFRSYNYALDAQVTVANGETHVSGEVGGQKIPETTVGTDATGSNDTDRDSVRNDIDNCPADFNFNQADLDQDKKGDACDEDADADQIKRPADCNDLNSSINPNAVEIADNGIDEDCSGADTITPAPVVTMGSTPPAVTNATTASFSFACEGTCTFECKFDAGAYAACTSPIVYTGLADGIHRFFVRSKGSNGAVSVSPASYEWSVDLTPPETTISTTFSQNVTTVETSLAFDCSGETGVCTFECAYDTAVYSSCTSPITVQHAQEGYQYLQVRAMDGFGNVDATPAYRAWTVEYPVTSPTVVTTSVSAGAMNSCAVATNGELYCWGSGHGMAPVRVGYDHDWRSVHAGENHTCAIKTNNALYCWGANTNYQVGTGSNTDTNTPTLIASGSAWKAIAPGSTHTCGVKTEGTLWCWGDNGGGTVGNGSTAGGDVQTVSQIGADTDWATVAAAYDHSCAVKTGGTLYCWGYNNMGQLGTGGTTQSYSPIQAGTDADWKSLAIYGSHSCALKTGGELYCWGDNTNGQLGHGQYPSAPLQVGTATWKAIDTDYDHTCGVQTNGTLWCWGNDGSEELGNGSVASDQAAPYQVGADTDWTDVATGYGHSLGVKTAAIYGWGDNTSGQVGDGSMVFPPAMGVADPSAVTFP